MNKPNTSVDVLLGRMEAVRALARRLVKDASEADEVVQDALLAALRRPSPVTGDARAWVGAVLRNAVRDRSRRSTRRQLREAKGAREEAIEGVDQAVLRAERQRELVGEVLALDEPMRTVVLLRYFEDLAPREIVARTGRSSAAVKDQLRRGLEKLRLRLEGRYGDRGAWAVALLPAIGPGQGAGLLAASGGAATGWLTAGLAVLGLALGGWWLWPGGEPGTDAGQDQAILSAQSLEAEGLPEEDSLELPAQGRRMARMAAELDGQGEHGGAPGLLATQDPRPLRLEGEPAFDALVLDLEGQPMEQQALVWSWPERKAQLSLRTDGQGVLHAEELSSRIEGFGKWSVPGNQQGLFLQGTRMDREEDDGSAERVLVLAPLVRIAGQVVGTDGAPAQGATVRLLGEVQALPDFSLRLATFQHGFECKSAADGRFDLGLVAASPYFRLEAKLGEARAQVGMPLEGSTELEFRLREFVRREAGEQLLGYVTDAKGDALGGLKVRYGSLETLTEQDGSFSLGVSYWDQGAPVTVEALDGRFASVPAPTRAQRAGGVPVLRLALPSELGRLHGRLVDQRGRGVADARVYLFDGTPQGSSSSLLERVGPAGRYFDFATDDSGAFEISRLQERDYTLRFLVPDSMLVVDAQGVRASDEELVVTVPEDAYRKRIVGRLVDFWGEPMAAAQLALSAPRSDPARGTWSSEVRDVAHTDRDGHFELKDSPWRGLSLVVRAWGGHGTGGQSFALDDQDLERALELRVDCHCAVSVDLAGDASVTRLRWLDAAGQQVPFSTRGSGQSRTSREHRRSGTGPLPKMIVQQRATTLVLLSDREELRREPVRLRWNEVNRLQP